VDGTTPRRAADLADKVSPGAGRRAPSRMAALRGLSPVPPAAGDAGAACDALASLRLGASAGPAAEQGSVGGGSARGADEEYGGLGTLETASEAELVLHALLAVAPLAAPGPDAGPGAPAAPPLAALLAAQLVACAEGQVRCRENYESRLSPVQTLAWRRCAWAASAHAFALSPWLLVLRAAGARCAPCPALMSLKELRSCRRRRKPPCSHFSPPVDGGNLRGAVMQAQEDAAARSAAIMLLHCCAAPLQPAAALLLLAPGPDPDPHALAGPAPTAEAPAAPRDPPRPAGAAQWAWQGGLGLGLHAAACPPAAQRHVLAAAAARALDAALGDCGDWAACQVRAHALDRPCGGAPRYPVPQPSVLSPASTRRPRMLPA